MPSPGTVAKPSTSGSPSSQSGKKVLTTRSPTANSLTPAPTAITSPAPSAIGMRGSLGPHMPLTTAKSW
ncbi:hypothetical protein D3C78_1266610 [compost metagenome]